MFRWDRTARIFAAAQRALALARRWARRVQQAEFGRGNRRWIWFVAVRVRVLEAAAAPWVEAAAANFEVEAAAQFWADVLHLRARAAV